MKWILMLILLAKMPMPDTFDKVEKMGCLCFQVTDFNVQRWHTRVWLEYKSGQRWERLYSIRENRKQSLKDCDAWLTEIYKRLEVKKKCLKC